MALFCVADADGFNSYNPYLLFTIYNKGNNMNEWSTEVPPQDLGLVFVACGDGETRVWDAKELTKEYHGLCWIAWKKI